MLVDKHRPKTLSDIAGNGKTLLALKVWLSKWKVGGKAALLYGPPGVGKTTAAYLLAEEFSLDVIEMNASDLRNKKEVERILGGAGRQASLFGKGKLLLVDEVDGMGGRGKGGDYGGVYAVTEVIKNANYPVILTANKAIISEKLLGENAFNPEKWERKFVGKKDNRFQVFSFLKKAYEETSGEKANDKLIWAVTYGNFSKIQTEGISAGLKALPLFRGGNWWEWNPKISKLKGNVELFEFSCPTVDEIASVVKRASKGEGISLEEGLAEELASRTGCDARASLTALEAVSAGRKNVSLKDIEGLVGQKDRRRLAEEAARLVLATSNPSVSRAAYRSCEDVSPDDFLSYVRENLPGRYEGQALSLAYRALSDADIVSGRIMSLGAQSLLPFKIDFMTGGVSVAKGEGVRGNVTGKIVSPISKFSASSVKARRIRKQISEKARKIAPHAKARDVIKLASIDPQVSKALGLEKEEEEFLEKWKKR